MRKKNEFRELLNTLCGTCVRKKKMSDIKVYRENRRVLCYCQCAREDGEKKNQTTQEKGSCVRVRLMDMRAKKNKQKKIIK
jgi:hypothetical protein